MRVPTTKGQSLLEILLAITVFTIGIVTTGYLLLDSLNSLYFATDSMEARLFADEGLEAVRSIRDGGYGNVPPGTYGLSLLNGMWVLSTTTESEGKFTRSVAITDVDESSKEVVALVTWTSMFQREKSLSLTTYLTNWTQTLGDARYLEVDIRNVAITASSTELIGLAFENTGDEDLTITALSLTWGTSALLNRVVIQGQTVFDSSPVSSGEEVDIEDYSVPAFTGFHGIDQIVFSEDVGSDEFIVTFILSDGSQKYVPVSL